MDANYYGLMAGVSGKTFDTESTITRAVGDDAVQDGGTASGAEQGTPSPT